VFLVKAREKKFLFLFKKNGFALAGKAAKLFEIKADN